MAGIPRVVGQFEFRPDGAGGDEFPVMVIAGRVKFLAIPDAQPAAAAAVADAIIVHKRAVVLVVMTGFIHGINDETAVLFNPHVRRAADGAFRRDERQGVGTVRDAIALPRKIVVTLRYVTRKGFDDWRR